MADKEHRARGYPVHMHGIGGLLSRVEANFLYDTPARIGEGFYGDLGTFHGRSSACMAGGMLDNTVKAHIITVDSYDGRGIKGRFRKCLRTPESTRNNLKEKGLDSYVTIVKGVTAEVAKDFQDKEFVFIFIDADHSYKGCKADFEAWSSLVKSGGEVAFHDANKETVNLVVNESGLKRYDIETIAVIVKP